MILKASQEQLKRYSVLNAMLLRSSAHFLIGLFFVAVVVELSFHLVCSFLCCMKAFKFHYVPFIYFVFISITLGGESKKILQ